MNMYCGTVCFLVCIEYVLVHIDIQYMHNTNPIHVNTSGMY